MDSPVTGPGSAVDGPSCSFEAVVLAGGRASRAGGADKPALWVGERTLAGWVTAAAVSAGATRVIIVGPQRERLLGAGSLPPGGAVFVHEDPPGSGPVAALRAGLAEVTAPLVALLAADLPFLRARHLAPLLRTAAAGTGAGALRLDDAGAGGAGAGAVLLDDGVRPQWLASCWRTAVLRDALAGYQGGSLHGLLRPLRPAMLAYAPSPGEPPPWLDCDTPEDVARARHLAAGLAGPQEGAVSR
jgi:molybdopterin-guanine dinucleotide biosynthesis protein A